jgi:hypothetical protein
VEFQSLNSFTVSIEADEITRLKTEDARRTLGIVALSLALSMGNTIPQGVTPAVTKTVPELGNC